MIYFNIENLVFNRVSLFLLRDYKGNRLCVDSTKFFNENKNKYNHILGEYSYLFKKLLSEALKSPHQFHKEKQDAEFFNYHGYERTFQIYEFNYFLDTLKLNT